MHTWKATMVIAGYKNKQPDKVYICEKCGYITKIKNENVDCLLSHI